MPNYRRAFIPGGTWFFTVNLLERHHNDLLIREINLLRETVRGVRERNPFHIDAWVVMPEHLHCVWTLPPGDSDFGKRWRLIKSGFSRALPKTERRSEVRKKAGERGIWQRHYWEHFIRDDLDYQRHVDYVHVNPLKHGRVKRVADLPKGHKGLIPVFINTSRKAFIHRIGAVMPTRKLAVTNDMRPITLR